MATGKKYAKKHVVRDPNTGRPSLQYVDTATGQPVSNLEGYEIIETTGFLSQDDLGINPLQSPTAGYIEDANSAQSGANVASQIKSNSMKANIPNGSAAGLGVGPAESKGTPANNFGFVGPGFSRGLGIASHVPGPIGLAGKVGSAAVGATNAAAVNQARQSIGLSSKSPGAAALGGAIGGFTGKGKGYNTGQVAEIDVGPSVAPVGFQALDPTTGRTNLTPTEARSRVARGLATEATPARVAAAKQSFAEEYGTSRKGPLSGLRSIVTGLFGTTTSDSFPQAPTNSYSSRGFDYSDYSFSSSDNTSKSANAGMSTAAQYGSYGQGRHSGFGNSAQAAAAASGETEGLY